MYNKKCINSTLSLIYFLGNEAKLPIFVIIIVIKRLIDFFFKNKFLWIKYNLNSIEIH